MSLTYWFRTDKGHPDHGDEVLTYRMDRGRICIGWWDKEIEDWIIYDANGTKRDRPDWYAFLPARPLHFPPGSTDDEREAQGGYRPANPLDTVTST